MRYQLILHPYSGCGPVECTDPLDDLDNCREVAAEMIREHRNRLKYPVTCLERGKEWELETGDDAAGISDDEGILEIVEIKGRECDECGTELEQDGQNTWICPSCNDDDAPRCNRCGALVDDESVDLCPDCEEDEDDDDE